MLQYGAKILQSNSAIALLNLAPYIVVYNMSNKKAYLGKTKGKYSERVYLYDFKWDCGWYWGGGYIGNNNFHAHFDGAFLNTPDIRGHCLGNFTTPWNKDENSIVISNGASLWEPLSFFLDDAQFDEKQWWRVKDLYKQFYIYKDAAAAFQYGGHMSGEGRSDEEINKSMAAKINKHIEDVVIKEIRKLINFK